MSLRLIFCFVNFALTFCTFKVCVWPSLLSRIIALFNGPDDHRSRLSGSRLRTRSALFSEAQAEATLRSLAELESKPREELLGLLRSMEALGVCYHLADSTNGKNAFLFPALRPACEIFHLPYLPSEDHLGESSDPIRCKCIQFTAPSSNYVDSAGELITKIQIRLRSMHDHRYQLFSNCIILRSRKTQDQALVSLWDSLSPPVIRVFCRGRNPDAMISSMMALVSDLQRLAMEELCGKCVQTSRYSKIDETRCCVLGHVTYESASVLVLYCCVCVCVSLV